MAKKVNKKTVKPKAAAKKPAVKTKTAPKPKVNIKPTAKTKAAAKVAPKATVKAKAVKSKPVVIEKKEIKKVAHVKTKAPVKTAPVDTVKKTAVHHDLVEIVSPSKKVKKVKGYSKKDLDDFKKVILEKREEIIEQLQNLKEQMMDPTTGQYVNENSPYSLHMAEQGTDAQEREKLYLWAQRENKFLGYLDDALMRIEQGTFGICIECIDEPQNLCPTCPLIPKDRLMAVPHTQHCLQIKQKMQTTKPMI
ncbi:MAG: conjugal transfer protein TraR [bacterium]